VALRRSLRGQGIRCCKTSVDATLYAVFNKPRNAPASNCVAQMRLAMIEQPRSKTRVRLTVPRYAIGEIFKGAQSNPIPLTHRVPAASTTGPSYLTRQASSVRTRRS